MINIMYTKDIVCPHCGEKHDDTDFRGEGDMYGEMECYSCMKPFSYEADIDVTWCTGKIPEPPTQEN